MDPAALGRYLRESREAKEITLDDAVDALRIRRTILESFEQGDFNVAESAVQVRGLLRNYARHLGLDEERILQYYQAAIEETRRKSRRQRNNKAPIAPEKVTDTPPSMPAVTLTEQRNRARGAGFLRSLFMLSVTVIAVGIIGYVSYEMLRPSLFPESSNAEPTADGLQIAAIPSATYTASWTPQPQAGTPTPDFNVSGFGGLQVQLNLVQRSWLRAVVDGAEQFVGIVEPGETLAYSGTESVNVTVANAAALEVTFNGQQQSQFGERGQQVEVRFSAAGIEVERAGAAQTTPTLTNTPLPTPTPLFADQLSPTPSATASWTPVPTAVASATMTAVVEQAAQPTLTPLFADGDATIEAPAEPQAAAQSDVASEDASADVQASPTPTIDAVTETATTPPRDATATAVLPPRATLTNPTATKTAP